jgi:CubicO group peptidase (beta-lactamase class C family)
MYKKERKKGKYGVEGYPWSDNPYVFESELQEFDAVTNDLAESALVSYLFYEDGKIKVDKKSPKNRFGDMFDDNDQLISMSIGKSMVSYLLGHAICKGYIKDVNERIDWWLLKDTLYDNQRLLDLINMRAGDQNYVENWNFLKAEPVDHPTNHPTIFSILEVSEKLEGTKKSKQVFNYNPLPPNIVLNYIIHKVDDEDEFQEFLNDIFQKKVGIENEVWFVKGGRRWGSKDEIDGVGKATFFASRYDYLRIAKAMLDDWNNNTCVVNYLKTIYENREPKNKPKWRKDDPHPFGATQGYGGFFHTDYGGYQGSPNIIVMDGFGGQEIWINFDDNRIVVTNAILFTYDWKKIVADPVRNGPQ